jgi:hypothetical protein
VPRETIVIPACSGLLHEAVAVFLAVMAYPYAEDHEKRDNFCTALWREQLRIRAAKDVEFASSRLPLPPGLSLISDATIRKAMRDGARRLAERKVAYMATHVLFNAVDRGQEIPYIEAFGTKTENTAVGRAMLAKHWEDRKWDGDSASAAKNLDNREIKQSRPVIHAVTAYWQAVLLGRSMLHDGEPVYASEEDVERVLLQNREAFTSLAECYRALAPSIPELHVGEGDLIKFRLV